MTGDEEQARRVVLDAAREFNGGRYFEAHEVLEEALDDVPDALWPLFLGLIQVAVGYHKLASGFDGAARMLEIGLEKLAPLPDDVLGIALGALRARAAADLTQLRSGGAERIDLHGAPPRLLPSG